MYFDRFRIVSEFNENSSQETSNQDRNYSNEEIMNTQKMGSHAIGKDKDETKIFSRGYNYGVPWKPSRSILDEEGKENERTKGLIKFFRSKKIFRRKNTANIIPDAFQEISFADPFTSAAEESKLLDQNYFENVNCDVNPLSFISLVDQMSFATFSQMIFGGISMVVHKNMKEL